MLTISIALGTVLLLAIWLVFLSRMPWSRRRWAIGAAVAVIAVTAATTRIRGVTGDLVPILEWRWASLHRRRCRPSPYPNRRDRLRPCRNRAQSRPPSPTAVPSTAPAASAPIEATPSIRAVGDYPQFLGADRNGTVSGIRIADDWAKRPPRLVWRRPVGAGWSGFAVARGLAVTQEQRGNREMVVAYDLATGVPKMVARRRGALRVDDCRRGPSRDANHLARARLHPWVDGTPQLPRPRNRPRHLEAGRPGRQPVAAVRVGQEQFAARRRQSDRRERRWRGGSLLVAYPATPENPCGTPETTSRATVRRSSRRLAACGNRRAQLFEHRRARSGSGRVLWSHPSPRTGQASRRRS